MLSQPGIVEDPEPNTLLIEDPSLQHGFVQLPKLVLYARTLSRDAKLLYAVLLGYAWQERRCFPGYTRLCADLDASENAVRKWMRELETAHVLSQRRRGLGLSNLYTLHDLRTAKIEVQEPHKTKVQEPHKTAAQEPQESQDYEETEKKETEQEHSGIRNSKAPSKLGKNPGNERLSTQASFTSTTKEKVLISGSGRRTDTSAIVTETPAVSRREANGKTKGQRRQGTSQAYQLAGKREKTHNWLSGYVVDFSGEFHDEEAIPSNSTRTVHLFERAKVDAETFVAQLYEARKITKGRANIQKRSGVGKNPAWPAGFPNRMPYFFRVLEDLLGLGGSTCSQDEDEQASGELATIIEAEASRGEEAADGDGTACPPAQAGLAEEGAAGEVACWSAQEQSLPASYGDAPTVPEPASRLPEGVEVVEAAVVATWRDHLPGPQNGQLRAVSMLWGFVRDAMSDHLTIARRSQLDGLTPKWDATRPRTLLLLCETTWAARAAELTLRREIEPQIGKLLSDFFDDMQVVYAPDREGRA